MSTAPGDGDSDASGDRGRVGDTDAAGGGRVFEVRRLTGVDVLAYRVVRLEALQTEPEAYGSTHAEWAGRPLSAFAERIENGAIFGIFTRAGLEGILSVDREPGKRSDHRAKIHQVYLRAPLRGSGAGRALISAAVGWARTEAIVQLELSVAEGNSAARALYSRANFRIFATWPRALRTDTGFEDEVQMILVLDDTGDTGAAN